MQSDDGDVLVFLCNAMQCNAVHSLVDNDESGEIRTRRFSFRSFLTLLF